MAFRAICQHVKERDWRRIKGVWISAAPRIEPTGSKPEPGLEHLEPLLAAFRVANRIELLPDVEGLRQNSLWEAIFLFHKASHVMRAAQSHAIEGFRSWSLFDAYHGAYLAAKSTMAFLGVALSQLDGQWTLLDLFP